MGVLDIFKKVRNNGIDTNDSGYTGEHGLEVGEVALVILTDRQVPNMYESFRDRGVEVYKIYSNIEDIKLGLLMQSGTCRVVVIETGLGEFTTVKMRDELVDLIGMCDGKEKRLTVFYTDSMIKTDSSGISPNNTTWEHYKSMSACIDRLLKYKERYASDDTRDIDNLIDLDRALSLMGKDSGKRPSNIFDLSLDVLEVLKNVTDTTVGSDKVLTSYDTIY